VDHIAEFGDGLGPSREPYLLRTVQVIDDEGILPDPGIEDERGGVAMGLQVPEELDPVHLGEELDPVHRGELVV